MTTPLERIRAELAAATPGPWFICQRQANKRPFIGTSPYHRPIALQATYAEADATLIVSAVNLLPALLDIAEAAQALHDSRFTIRCEPALSAALKALNEVSKGDEG